MQQTLLAEMQIRHPTRLNTRRRLPCGFTHLISPPNSARYTINVVIVIKRIRMRWSRLDADVWSLFSIMSPRSSVLLVTLHLHLFLLSLSLPSLSTWIPRRIVDDNCVPPTDVVRAFEGGWKIKGGGTCRGGCEEFEKRGQCCAM